MELFLKQDEFENVFKKHIKTSVYSLSIKTLFGERMTRKINYHPYYQRNYVWDNSKGSFFIESILLGTDVPPLIFFNTGSSIEVIDGRQRYETIKRFRNGDLKLHIKGLSKLTELQKKTFSKLDPDIQGLLDDAKIRIFEFEVINEPKLTSSLEDKIKKEIFRRYNSGITPLNSAEIDNATYDDDDITNKLKAIISKEVDLIARVSEKFLSRTASGDYSSKVLQFFRRYIILSSFPINTYATGSNRTEILDLLYNVKSENTEDPSEICKILLENLCITLDLIDHLELENNKLVNETLLWAIFILYENNVNLEGLSNKRTIKKIQKFLNEHSSDFLAEKSHHYKSIITRHKIIGGLFSELFDFDYSLYIRDEDFKNRVKELRQSEQEAKLKLGELSSLRVQKPEPSLIPVEEITAELSANKYMIRPSYQRQEKINVLKASAIIESIILGISLPRLFIYKNRNSTKEVIDGQQRLLSILGFLGKNYLDEKGDLIYPKNKSFKLKGLKILRELNGKRYEDLEFLAQDKILDFKLSVIEIDAALNNNFDPVDLFIRLNNKPYPIKENSFEMWNSFVDKEVIERIKEITKENNDWFYIKQVNESRSSDRMLNEELITLLVYIYYNSINRRSYTSIGFYLRDHKVNCRITDKKDVSSLLEKISMDFNLKKSFLESITAIERFIETIKNKLDPEDYKTSLNLLFFRDSNKRYLVDFYILFQILQRIDEGELDTLSFDCLQNKLGLVLSQIRNPSNNNTENQQSYFEKLMDEVSS